SAVRGRHSPQLFLKLPAAVHRSSAKPGCSTPKPLRTKAPGRFGNAILVPELKPTAITNPERRILVTRTPGHLCSQPSIRAHRHDSATSTMPGGALRANPRVNHRHLKLASSLFGFRISPQLGAHAGSVKYHDRRGKHRTNVGRHHRMGWDGV